MKTPSGLSEALHSMTQIFIYLFTLINTHTSPTTRQFLILCSAACTACLLVALLNRAINALGALLDHILCAFATFLDNALQTLEELPAKPKAQLEQKAKHVRRIALALYFLFVAFCVVYVAREFGGWMRGA